LIALGLFAAPYTKHRRVIDPVVRFRLKFPKEEQVGAPEEIRLRTREFIKRHFRNLEFDDDEDIFALGFVNSLFALQLVMFVEKTFEMSVDDEDLNIENFKSINAVADLVRRKTA
jgi:methoxymalonate biosynthesis acyl carrier protein